MLLSLGRRVPEGMGKGHVHAAVGAGGWRAADRSGEPRAALAMLLAEATWLWGVRVTTSA
eukprot:364283-Chlamydomonas_euryale.AAC.40